MLDLSLKTLHAVAAGAARFLITPGQSQGSTVKQRLVALYMFSFQRNDMKHSASSLPNVDPNPVPLEGPMVRPRPVVTRLSSLLI